MLVTHLKIKISIKAYEMTYNYVPQDLRHDRMGHGIQGTFINHKVKLIFH